MKASVFAVILIGWLGFAGSAWAQVEFELRADGFERVAEPAAGADAELQAVRTALAEGRPGEALDRASAWIDANRRHSRMPEALLLRGDAKVMREDYFKALFDYEFLVRRYPDSPQFMTGLEREFEIARMFGQGMKRKLWGMRILSAAGEAEELLIRIQERAPGSRLAEKANIELGDFYFRRGEMALAAEAYDIFLGNFPESLMAEHAWQRLIDANLATFHGPRFDATGLYEARQRLGEFEQAHPLAAEAQGGTELAARIDESLAEKTLIKADWYAGQGRDVSAAFLYRRIVETHPGTAAAGKARQALVSYGERRVARLTRLPPAVAVQQRADSEPGTEERRADPLDTPGQQPVDVEDVEIRPDDLLPEAPEVR